MNQLLPFKQDVLHSPAIARAKEEPHHRAIIGADQFSKSGEYPHKWRLWDVPQNNATNNRQSPIQTQSALKKRKRSRSSDALVSEMLLNRTSMSSTYLSGKVVANTMFNYILVPQLLIIILSALAPMLTHINIKAHLCIKTQRQLIEIWNQIFSHFV